MQKMEILDKLIRTIGLLLLAGLIICLTLAFVSLIYGAIGIVICLILSHFNMVDFTLMNCAMLGLSACIIRILTSRNQK